jgi:DNA primase
MDFAQQLKSSIDIAEVIGKRVRLKRVGSSSRYMGLCPFHTEKTPSFSVNTSMQIYKCFGCGVAGDVIRFVMEFESISFYEALKLLAERHGIPMPKRSEYADRDSQLREAIHSMNDVALEAFRKNLLSPQGRDARAYLESRGVSMETAERFGLGLAERGSEITRLLEKQGFTQEQIEQSGLVIKRQEAAGVFDRFRARLMFPIHSESGKVAGFAGRALQAGDEPKYLNSPETLAYKKSLLLYNLNRAKDMVRKKGRCILVEGYMDVIGLAAAGVPEVVASCGTALTSPQVRLMKRFADQVTVNFDPDAGGSRGAEQSIRILLDEHVRVRILEFGEDLDPDEYVKQYGIEMYLQLLERAPNYYFWLADQAKKRFDSRTAEGRAQALQFLLPSLQRIPDRIERAGVANDLASYLGVEPGLVLEQFKKAAIDRREQKTPYAPPAVRPVELILMKALLLYPDLRGEILDRLEKAPGLGQFRSKGIFLSMLQLHRHQPEFRYMDLDARLEENDRALLSEMVFADEMEGEDKEAARQNALACLKTIEAGEKESRAAQLRLQIRQAQQRGDMASAMRLVEELDRLHRSGGSS